MKGIRKAALAAWVACVGACDAPLNPDDLEITVKTDGDVPEFSWGFGDATTVRVAKCDEPCVCEDHRVQSEGGGLTQWYLLAPAGPAIPSPLAYGDEVADVETSEGPLDLEEGGHYAVEIDVGGEPNEDPSQAVISEAMGCAPFDW